MADTAGTKLHILLADDEATIREVAGRLLRARGHSVTTAADGARAAAYLSEHVYDLVITDVRLPRGADGFSLLRRIRRESPDTDVLLITAYGTVADAVCAMREHAADYLTKPFDIDVLLRAIDRIAERRRLKAELSAAKAELAGGSTELIGRSPAMAYAREHIETVAASDAPVLIAGESGTGKELAARMIHGLGERRDRPFVALNCAAFPQTLLEEELFGHERGSFTGAVQRRVGRFKAADGGTLFLDEIAEMPLESQAKLLRVLQDGTFEPIGTNTTEKVDVRVISATHRSLKDRVRDGRFREDLYYRIRVLQVSLPPLRERFGDIPLLVQHFLRRATRSGKPAPSMSPRALAALELYDFPGNVREMEHAITHGVVHARGGEVDVAHLPAEIRDLATAQIGAGAASGPPGLEQGTLRPLALAIEAFEREYLLRALRLSHGERTRAAEMLGISRKNLWQKMRKHRITTVDPGDGEPASQVAAVPPGMRLRPLRAPIARSAAHRQRSVETA